MKWDAIWPVLTLALGWLFGELSGIIRSSRGRREELRLVTFRLLALIDDIELFIYLCDEMPRDIPTAGSAQKAEDLRQQIFLRWSNQQDLIESSSDAVITSVARFDPSLAYRIHGSLVTLRSMAKRKIGEGPLTDSEIITFNALRRFLSDELHNELTTISRLLARKAGPFTAWRVRSLLRGKKGAGGLHHAGKMVTELRDKANSEVDLTGLSNN